ncbi:flagellar export chaperone FliS [Jonesia quinghaiensis]|uniref:flagellar export chaperone FliS n=1 Tax=Jonesia quinghaiensis TaxID=262806 RepID=UPI0004164F09|nr:flagellar export chaperone FliS [Jonesia quinghaiensis]
MNYTMNKDTYLQDAVYSASPARLLTMLFDRLVLDLERAEKAIEARTPLEATPHLIHAQDIVTELTNTLNVEMWEGGRQLQALYLHLYSALVSANTSKEVSEVRDCREIIEPLRQTWHEAAQQVAAKSAQAAPAPRRLPVSTGASSFGELGVG